MLVENVLFWQIFGAYPPFLDIIALGICSQWTERIYLK